MEAAAFQGWRAGARWKAGARQKVDRCSRRMQSLNKSRAFATWLERAQIRLDARYIPSQDAQYFERLCCELYQTGLLITQR